MIDDTLEDLNNLPQNLYSVGGGTKNALWSQTTSDVIGLDQILRKITFGASYGDAFLSAYSIGDVNKEDIDEWNKIDSKIISQKKEAYEKGFKFFRSLYEQTKDIMKDMDY